MKKSTLAEAAPQKEQFKGKSALDFFLNLLSLVTLAWLSLTVGGVYFQIVNKFFTSGASIYGLDLYYQTALKSSLAGSIILLPIFIIAINILHRNYKLNKLNHHSNVYKWLTYIMLLVSLLVSIGSLIALLVNLLNGDYAAKIILKVLTVMLISLGIFIYYLLDIRRKDYSKKEIVSVAAMVILLAVSLFAIIFGLTIIDSPIRSRMKKFDLQRVYGLSQLNAVVISSYTNQKKLPEKISGQMMNQFVDPETKKFYEYRRLDDSSYELCATFSMAVDTTDAETYAVGEEWMAHGAGRQCYTLQATDLSAQKIIPNSAGNPLVQ